MYIEKRVIRYLKSLKPSDTKSANLIVSDFEHISNNGGSAYILEDRHEGVLNMTIASFEGKILEGKLGKHRVYIVLKGPKVCVCYAYYKQDTTVKKQEREQIIKAAKVILSDPNI